MTTKDIINRDTPKNAATDIPQCRFALEDHGVELRGTPNPLIPRPQLQ